MSNWIQRLPLIVFYLPVLTTHSHTLRVSKQPLEYATCKLQGKNTHTHTYTRSPVCWRIWMNNYHDMQTHKSREHETKFHYIRLGFLVHDSAGQASSTVLPCCCPSHPTSSHIWVHIFGPWPNRVHRCRHSSPTEAIPTGADSESEGVSLSSHCVFVFIFA